MDQRDRDFVVHLLGPFVAVFVIALSVVVITDFDTGLVGLFATGGYALVFGWSLFFLRVLRPRRK